MESKNKEFFNEEDAVPIKKQGNKKRRARKIIAVILAVLIALPLITFGTFLVMRAVGKSRLSPVVVNPANMMTHNDRVVSYDEGKTLNYNGKKYVYNENIVPIAFMGIDTLELGTDWNYSRDVGQSDSNMVLALDTETGNVAMIVIPRDSMVDMNVYDKNGDYSGMEKMQLCLSYSFGDGKEKSCENTLECIERILCGIEISSYVSLDLSGIGSINDAIGGVELESIETIADFKEGEKLHLWGENARNYVQRRDTTKFNSDSLRRQRQLQYVKAFAAKALEEIKNDFTLVTKLYNVSREYTCTNINLADVTYLASAVVSNPNINLDDIYVIDGEAVMGEHFMEVYVDETSALETVLAVFYNLAE